MAQKHVFLLLKFSFEASSVTQKPSMHTALYIFSLCVHQHAAQSKHPRASNRMRKGTQRISRSKSLPAKKDVFCFHRKSIITFLHGCNDKIE